MLDTRRAREALLLNLGSVNVIAVSCAPEYPNKVSKCNRGSVLTFFISPKPSCVDTLTTMSRQQLSTLLLVIAGLLVLAAAVTLLPYSSPRINDFGYRSLCPFAPYSTATLLLGAALAWIVRSYLNQKT